MRHLPDIIPHEAFTKEDVEMGEEIAKRIIKHVTELVGE